jgi:hypothetical protein
MGQQGENEKRTEKRKWNRKERRIEAEKKRRMREKRISRRSYSPIG